MDKIKLLLVAPVPPPYGGIANWTVLMQGYLAQKDEVELVGLLNIAPKRRGLDGQTLFERVVVQGFAMLGGLKELKKIIKEKKPSVVHMTTSGQLAIIRDIMFLRLCRKKKVKTVYHIRFGRVAEISRANTKEWRLMKKAISLSSVTVPIDETTEEALKGHFPDKIVKIANPFDMSTAEGYPTVEPKKEVMFLGWHLKTKGVEELLSAWSRVAAEHPDWTLRMVGPYDEAYLDRLKGTYPCKNVVFEGEKAHGDAMSIMNESGVFILPSYTEGFPNVILEAMALSKPIIATDVGAIKEMIADESGILIPPQDAEAIENALNRLLSDAELRQKLAVNAYERVKNNYDINIIYEKYKKIWSKNNS